MAVVKQLDWHLEIMQSAFPDIVKKVYRVDEAGDLSIEFKLHGLFKPNGDPLSGTPFKMRFLTNGNVPITAKLCVLFYFGAFFGVFAALLAYYAIPLFKGFFRFHPVAWSICFLGGSGFLVQIMDRFPAWYRHLSEKKELGKGDFVNSPFGSFCTCFEEGSEMILAIFALLAILQAHTIYTRQIKPHCESLRAH